jgi:hypothetical protein
MRVEIRVGRFVAELGILDQQRDGGDPEAVHTAFQPEAHHVQQGDLHFGVAPVEVGLLRQEGVQSSRPLASSRVQAGPPKVAQPVVGRAAFRRGVAPQVPSRPG